MTNKMHASLLLVIGALLPAHGANSDSLEVHDDYYLGFAQGAYYGLMLAGEDYHVAWCMKSELEHEVRTLGTGGEFQQRIETLLVECRANNRQD